VGNLGASGDHNTVLSINHDGDEMAFRKYLLNKDGQIIIKWTGICLALLFATWQLQSFSQKSPAADNVHKPLRADYKNSNSI
jgi:hypothetical protein